MRGPLQHYMQVGIVHFMAYPECLKGEGPVLETVRRIAEDDFFSAIEVTWIKDPAVREAVARLLEQAHLAVGYGAQPPLLTQKLDLNAFDAGERKRAVDQVKACIDEAVQLGAKAVAVLSGPASAGRRDEAIKLLVDSLRDLCGYARTRGPLPIFLETFDHQIDKKCLIGPSEDARTVAAELGRDFPDFGLMIDLSHLPLQGETPQHCFGLVKEYIGHIHIGNCILKAGHPASGDQHPRLGHPDGVNDVLQVAEFLEALFAIGYLGEGRRPIVAFEVKPLPGESSEAVIAGAKRTLQAAWARLASG